MNGFYYATDAPWNVATCTVNDAYNPQMALDNQQALNTAFSTIAGNGGGKLFLPNGVIQTLEVQPQPGCQVIGAGENATLVTGPFPGADCVMRLGIDNVNVSFGNGYYTVRDLQLRGAACGLIIDSNTPNNGGTTDIYLEHVISTSQDGIRVVVTLERFTWRDCQFSGGNGTGMYVQGGPANDSWFGGGAIERCRFWGQGANCDAITIAAPQVNGVKFDSCVLGMWNRSGFNRLPGWTSGLALVNIQGDNAGGTGPVYAINSGQTTTGFATWASIHGGNVANSYPVNLLDVGGVGHVSVHGTVLDPARVNDPNGLVHIYQ